jgi:hypothetical protein
MVRSITFERTCYGTPGINTTLCSIDSKMMKAVAQPKMTKVILYIYTPRIMKRTPMISMAIVYPRLFLEKYVQIVDLDT